MFVLLTIARHTSGIFRRAADLDARAVQVLRRRSGVDLELGETLVELFRGDRLLRLGYAKPADYGRERLGLPARSLRQFTRLARGLSDRPVLRHAVRSGLVSMRKALLVLPFAVGENEALWTTAAAGLTEKELRGRIAASGGEPGDEPFDVETLLLRMSPEQQDRLDEAIRMADVVLGGVGPRWRAVEAIAMEWAAGHGASWPEEREERRPEIGDPCEPWRPRTPAGAAGPAAEPLPTDPRELDARALALAKERVSFDLVFGPLLAKIHRDRLWREMGLDSFEEYTRDRLGVSARSVRQRIWLERQMDELPEIREALDRGTLTFTKALFVAKDATPGDVVERIEEAAATTWQQVERDSGEKEDRQNRAAGVRRLWGPRDAFETVSMAIVAAQDRFRAEGEFVSAGEALAQMADHFAAVWREEVERIKRGTPKKRRRVLERNGGYCAFPGCTRPAEHDHHVRFRSLGGSDEVTNRVGLCVPHHLRAIHEGFATLTGRAGERLLWQFATDERFVTIGEKEVRRQVET